MTRPSTARHPDQIPLLVPDSDWRPPSSLPEIPTGALVAIDTETRDNGLAQGMGPSWCGSLGGHLCGVSWAWEGGSGYAPTRHPDTECMDETRVLEWLRDLERRCRVVFQNAGYDLGWTGIWPTQRVHDTLAMAVLLDETHDQYNLDAIARRLGIPGKDERLLREAALAHGIPLSKIKANLWRLPGRYVGPYADADAVATLEAARIMLPQLEASGLMEAYELECDLTPWTIEMRRRGIPVDIDVAEQNQSWFRQQRARVLDEITELVEQGRTIGMDEIRSPRWLSHTFRTLGLTPPRTAGTEKNPEGQDSFEKEWLEKCPHPLGPKIAQARALNDAAEKFIGTYIMEYVDRGRIHAEIHQLRSDEGGTRTFRFSYSNPPLQQMNRAEPDRANPEHKDYTPGFIDIGTKIRECFVPERGEVWGAPDYSQQEYRLIVHYAIMMGLPRAEVAAEKYATDPNTDFHNFVVEMTGLLRKKAKDANFAKAFGAGVPKFAIMTGMSVEEAADVMQTYDRELPFVKRLSERCGEVAAARGYIRLLDGRRCHFNQWEVSWIPKEEWEAARAAGKLMTPCSREEALARQADPKHPWSGKRLRRWGTHKAGNRVIQGGAAVQTKRALLAQCREGYVPLLQMHDELCHSVGDPVKARRIAEIMRDIVPLRVPVRVDNEFGPDWGRAKYSFEKAMEMVRSGEYHRG